MSLSPHFPTFMSLSPHFPTFMSLSPHFPTSMAFLPLPHLHETFSPLSHLHEPSFPNDPPAWGHQRRKVLSSKALLDLHNPPCVLLHSKVLINVFSHLINLGTHVFKEGMEWNGSGEVFFRARACVCVCVCVHACVMSLHIEAANLHNTVAPFNLA